MDLPGPVDNSGRFASKLFNKMSGKIRGFFSKNITIGLGIEDDLWRHSGTGAITWLKGGWQRAGLTTEDVGRATYDPYYFKKSFEEAVENAGAVRFDVTNFDPFFSNPRTTNYEFDYIINRPCLLEKTKFFKNGNEVFWNGSEFIKNE